MHYLTASFFFVFYYIQYVDSALQPLKNIYQAHQNTIIDIRITSGSNKFVTAGDSIVKSWSI